MKGTTSNTMQKILRAMSEDPQPLPRIAEKISMSDSNLRRAMSDMEELGIVKKVKLPPPSKRERRCMISKPCMFGWTRTVIPVIR